MEVFASVVSVLALIVSVVALVLEVVHSRRALQQAADALAHSSKGLEQSATALEHSSKGLEQSATALEHSSTALEHSAEANELASLDAIIALEGAVREVRSRLSAAGVDVQRNPDDRFALAHLEEMEEQFLNLLDRLCACIRWGYVEENLFRADYRVMLNDIVNQTDDKKLQQCRHIMVVNNKWKDDKPALESTPAERRARKT